MDELYVLSEFKNWTFTFVIVLARTSVVVMLLPGLGEIESPAILRAGLALGLTVLLTPGLGVIPTPDQAQIAIGMIVAECVVGAFLGWLARLPVIALSVAGSLISYMVGLSSVIQYDPALGGQSSVLAKLFGLAAPVLILSGGLIQLPITALSGSYHIFPPGSVLPSDQFATGILLAVSECLTLGLRLATPFLISTLLMQTSLAVLARLVPQLQIYAAAIPGQILGGLALLSILISAVLLQWQTSLHEAWQGLPGL